jgi:hypothetical protein
METIHNYRHTIDRERALIFEDALKRAIKETHLKYIGFVGLIIDYKKKEFHDLDVLIFPSEKAKIGEAILELLQLYNKVENILKEKNERHYVVTCSRKTMQELIYYLAGMEEGNAGLIPIHSLFFPDYKSFLRINPKKFNKDIQKKLITLFGDFEIIKKIKAIPQEKLEPYFVILDFELSARIKTFPRHNIRASAESLFSYLEDKYHVPHIKKVPHDIKEIEMAFENVIKKLDMLTYA